MEEEKEEERSVGRKNRRRRRPGKSSVSAGPGDSSCSAAAFAGRDVTDAAATSIATPRRLDFVSRNRRKVKALKTQTKDAQFAESQR